MKAKIENVQKDLDNTKIIFEIVYLTNGDNEILRESKELIRYIEPAEILNSIKERISEFEQMLELYQLIKSYENQEITV